MNWQGRRKALDWSQSDLAEAVGISRTALSQIENGHHRPSSPTRDALLRCLDPFAGPTRLLHGEGPLPAAETVEAVASGTGLSYALTLDVAAWLLTGYQTPATAWAYVRPLEEWKVRLAAMGIHPAPDGVRADLVLLRAPDEALAATRVVLGLRVVSSRRLVEDCARLGGRHALDGARVYLEDPAARGLGLRLDADAMWKVFEEAEAWT